MTAAPPVLEVMGLGIGARAGAEVRHLLRDVTFSASKGESIGIVGESGAGKSTLALALLGDLRDGCLHTAGQVLLDGADLLSATPRELRRLRGSRIALVPQDAGQSLTPTMRIGALLAEAIALGAPSDADPRWRSRNLLEMVQLPAADLVARYPHQLSGGQQQRVAVALALAGEPRILLLDEPTTGLDITTQARLLAMLSDLRLRTGVAMIIISHDIAAVSALADRVLVMYAGRVVEDGPTAGILSRPGHPYTRALLAAVPRIDRPALPLAMPGIAPRAGFAPRGCAFRPRCPSAAAVCHADPQPAEVGIAWMARCHFAGIDPPATELGGTVRPRPSRPVSPSSGDPLLQVKGLAATYRDRDPAAIFRGRPGPAPAVSDIGFSAERGETVALIGQSGSGKSTIVRAIAGLLPPSSGAILLDGQLLPAAARNRSLDARRRIQLIFQNPDASLNPRHTVRQLLAQPLRLYEPEADLSRDDRWRDLLERVRLSGGLLDRYPAQLSGGEKQRVAIARALAARPDLLLCDEITSSLDVSVQAAVLDLLATLQRDHGISVIVVSHDLAVVRAIADRVVVLDRGRICETGPTEAVYSPPHHPLTASLLAAAAVPGWVPPGALSTGSERLTDAGMAGGCPYRDRCPWTLGLSCAHGPPPVHSLPGGKRIACRLPLDRLEWISGPQSRAFSPPEQTT